MNFERIQSQKHEIADSTIDVLYDRFTTKFVVKENNALIYSVFLGICPIRKSEIVVNGNSYSLEIFWLLLWRSKIINKGSVVINELLARRRRQSIVVLVYMAIITSMKIGLTFVS
jgi:hypothetical protein